MKLFKRSVVVCDHVYCYRDWTCTRCGQRHQGTTEPIYTPHFFVDGELRPETDIEGRLGPYLKVGN